MERYCDLHTHSVFSDGTCTPEQIVDLAIEIGLSAIALCDHNTIAGLPDFFAAAQGKPIEVVGGIEMSTQYEDKDLHIVGLCIGPEHYQGITDVLEETNRRKIESNRKLIKDLGKLGYVLDYDELSAQYPGGNINRAHIAAALMEKGYTASIKEAFSGLLSDDGGIYQAPEKIGTMKAISYLKSIGAVAILAHPFYDFTEQELEEFLPEAKAAGLDGMETLYSSFDAHQRAAAARIAEKFGLLSSGGSDFHGANKPDIRLGRGKGDLFVPEAFLATIKNRKNADNFAALCRK